MYILVCVYESKGLHDWCVNHHIWSNWGMWGFMAGEI